MKYHNFKFICMIFCILCLFFACQDASSPPPQIQRENLFSMSLGKMEDQLDLFQISGGGVSYKTRIAMQNGLFFIANGNSKKIVELTSFGDLLSMIYNPDSNPIPISLKTSTEANIGATRLAYQYPLLSPGEIVITSNQDVFVEDKLPQERKVLDEKTKILLDKVILRFSRTGEYKDYLGQEGIGGTPFPYIAGLYCTKNNEIVVVSMTQTNWQIFWYTQDGIPLYNVVIDRNTLPIPGKDKLIASLEKVVPDTEEHLLYLKLDYYKEAVDPNTQQSSGVEYASSSVFIMNPKDASYTGNITIPSVTKTDMEGQTKISYQRLYEFIGSANGRNLFFMMPDEKNSYVIMIYNIPLHTMKRISIAVSADEMFYNVFQLSNTGILSAIFASEFDARVVWWRTDKLIGEVRQ